ncbi:hypothetical protein ACFP3I_16865 [Chryseobacterium arachidis]|uniref:hypothetical protein n=1 Tax=Chryseobacterium arachidis TaxID=1416778 RepID=UPI003606CDF7
MVLLAQRRMQNTIAEVFLSKLEIDIRFDISQCGFRFILKAFEKRQHNNFF